MAPYENLWEDKDDIDSVLKKIKQFKDDLNSAVSNDSEHRASVILREQFCSAQSELGLFYKS